MRTRAGAVRLGIVAALVLVSCTAEVNPGSPAAPTAATVAGSVDGAGTTAPPDPAGGEPVAAAPPATNADGGVVEADATARGIVTHRDGTMAVGAPVTVTRGGSTASEVFGVVLTLGLACFTPEGCAGVDLVEATTTGGDGSYSAVLPDAYLAGFETDEDWYVAASLPAGAGELAGPTSSTEFEVNTALQEVPPLPLWDAAPAVTADGSLLRIDLAPAPVVPDGDGGAPIVWLVDGANIIAWQTAVGERFDARVVEDVALSVVGSFATDVTVAHAEGRTIYHHRIASAIVGFQGSAVPISRGAACTVDPGPTLGCPLTDGILGVAATAVDQPLVSYGSGTVDLGAPMPIGLVVARGCTGCDVATSVDGVTFAALPTTYLAGAIGVGAAPAAPTDARFVRVTADPTYGSITEISVWPPLPAAPGIEVVDGLSQPGAAGDGPGSASSDDDPSVLLPAVLAALLVGLVAAGAAAAWSRRG